MQKAELENSSTKTTSRNSKVLKTKTQNCMENRKLKEVNKDKKL